MGIYRVFASPDGESHIEELRLEEHPELGALTNLTEVRVQQFDGTMRPVLQDLDAALVALDSAPADFPNKSLHVPLLELHHQLQALCDKVAEQQAYVLIFGPLKSGKSTLMNAIAASYVSEVSSLPAYPCIVYLSHREERQFDVTRYSGQKERFTDPAAPRAAPRAVRPPLGCGPGDSRLTNTPP